MKDSKFKKACRNFDAAIKDQIKAEQARIAFFKKDIEFSKRAIANARQTISIAKERQRDSAKLSKLSK